MNLLQKIKLKVMYWWNTRGLSDTDMSEIHIPFYDEEEDVTDVAIIEVNGEVYKMFTRVMLTLEIDPRWTDDHLHALASFMVNYPEDITIETLLPFLHPEFYLINDDNQE